MSSRLRGEGVDAGRHHKNQATTTGLLNHSIVITLYQQQPSGLKRLLNTNATTFLIPKHTGGLQSLLFITLNVDFLFRTFFCCRWACPRSVPSHLWRWVLHLGHGPKVLSARLDDHDCSARSATRRPASCRHVRIGIKSGTPLCFVYVKTPPTFNWILNSLAKENCCKMRLKLISPQSQSSL